MWFYAVPVNDPGTAEAHCLAFARNLKKQHIAMLPMRGEVTAHALLVAAHLAGERGLGIEVVDLDRVVVRFVHPQGGTVDKRLLMFRVW